MDPPYIDILGSGMTVDASTITYAMQVRELIPSLRKSKGRLKIGYVFVIDTKGDAFDWEGWEYRALIIHWPGGSYCFLDDLQA